jgi:outer membrane protein, multidrug efflux system
LARDAELILDETEHWLERTIEQTEQALAANRGVTEQDLLRLQTAEGALQLGLNQARAGKRQAQAGLVAYLALPPSGAVEPAEDSLTLLPTAPSDAKALTEIAERQRPELRALSEGSAAYNALAKAEEAGNLPDFFALAFAQGAYTPGRDLVQTRYVTDPLNGFYPGLLVGARWQITGSMASERAAEQRAKALELDHTRRWAVFGMPAEVTKAAEDVQRAKLDVEQANKALGHAKQWAVVSSADFSVGLGNSRDVADAATAYLQLRLAVLDATFRHNVALAELARATGTLNVEPSRFYPTTEH